MDVFAGYNETVWPAQWMAYLVGAAIVAILLTRGRKHRRWISAGLAAMWLWTGVAYHMAFFASINRAAWLFGALFVVQAGLLFFDGVIRGRLAFQRPSGPAGQTGAGLIVYAAILYPLIGMATGHAYPEMPMFGITPCPVTLFTFGLLLLARPPLPKRLLIVPALWSLVGGSAAILLAVPQDWLLLVSGFVAIPLVLWSERKRSPAA